MNRKIIAILLVGLISIIGCGCIDDAPAPIAQYSVTITCCPVVSYEIPYVTMDMCETTQYDFLTQQEVEYLLDQVRELDKQEPLVKCTWTIVG